MHVVPAIPTAAAKWAAFGPIPALGPFFSPQRTMARAGGLKYMPTMRLAPASRAEKARKPTPAGVCATFARGATDEMRWNSS